MKALTISQPFASLIASGEKWVENRTWETFYRGVLAIHAGKGTQYLSRRELADYPTGCIVAVARLTACLHLSAILEASDAADPGGPTGCGRTWKELAFHSHTQGPFCWILEDVVKIDEPLPCQGAQGLWVPPVTLGLATRRELKALGVK